MILEKTEVAGLYKDVESKAVINTDNDALTSYKAKKMQLRKMNSMENRILRLEKELMELKETLSSILRNTNHA